MARDIVVMVVWDVNHPVNPLMVDKINQIYNLNIREGDNFMYMYNSRTKERGYFRKKDGVDVLIAPLLDHGFYTLDKNVVEFMSVDDYNKIEFDEEEFDI